MKKRKVTILVIDDTEINLKTVEMILRKQNYNILSADTGEKALRWLSKIKPDIILLDIILPDINGFEICKKIKSNEKLKKIPVIFLTSKENTEDIVKGFEIGAVDYITKPFRAAELIARLSNHIELSKTREELEEAIENIKVLSGLIPICSHCKKIRDDAGFWNKLETYIETHSLASFTHGICPDCLKKYYPEISDKILNEKS